MSLEVRIVNTDGKALQNAVHFTNTQYNFTLVENQPTGTVVGNLEFEDAIGLVSAQVKHIDLRSKNKAF